MPGRFITFEGGEGAGKTTQMRRLAEALQARGIDVVATREPGGTPRAEAIRESLLSGEGKAYGPYAEALMFYAARHDHLEKLIRPALAAGQWVLCDRFSDSTRAYQGAAGAVDSEALARLEDAVVGRTRPHLTLILDLPPEEGLARARARRGPGQGAGDRFEAETLPFHEKLRAAFLDIAASEPERCAVIDARDEAAVVADAIWAAACRRLPELASRSGDDIV